jgi:gamma-glutamyltranspeptidase/glutathione hydrolase
VDAPRLHHQWFPDQLRFEGTADHAEAVKKLRAMGHAVSGGRQGDAHTIRVDPKTGRYYGAEDRRINGKVSAY